MAARRRLGTLLGLALGLAAAAGGFFAVSAGYLPRPMETIRALLSGPPQPDWASWEAPEYVTLPPLTVSLGPSAAADHLRIAVMLEISPGAGEVVTAAEPRIIAGLVRFLRAVDERDFDIPALMIRLQAQMLRRVELAVPPGTVRAVLIQEFLLN
ncbi:MAG: flagellar basal body-associated FliL family protein [Pseudomonadota bacterium]